MSWFPVIKDEQILGAQVTISNINRAVDQIYALICTTSSLIPRLRPVHYQKVRLSPLKCARDLIFDPFLRFFCLTLQALSQKIHVRISVVSGLPCVRFTVVRLYLLDVLFARHPFRGIGGTIKRRAAHACGSKNRGRAYELKQK